MYGYIAIYLFYGIFLSIIIAKRRFPLTEAASKFDINTIKKLKDELVPPPQPINTDNHATVSCSWFYTTIRTICSFKDRASQKINTLRQAEHPLVIITVIYIIIFVILSLARPKKVPLPNLHVNSRELHFFVAWAFIVVLIAAFYSTFVVIRLYMRRT